MDGWLSVGWLSVGWLSVVCSGGVLPFRPPGDRSGSLVWLSTMARVRSE